MTDKSLSGFGEQADPFLQKLYRFIVEGEELMWEEVAPFAEATRSQINESLELLQKFQTGEIPAPEYLKAHPELANALVAAQKQLQDAATANVGYLHEKQAILLAGGSLIYNDPIHLDLDGFVVAMQADPKLEEVATGIARHINEHGGWLTNYPENDAETQKGLINRGLIPQELDYFDLSPQVFAELIQNMRDINNYLETPTSEGEERIFESLNYGRLITLCIVLNGKLFPLSDVESQARLEQMRGELIEELEANRYLRIMLAYSLDDIIAIRKQRREPGFTHPHL